MGLLGRAATSDDVLLWEHGRRFGIIGDGEFPGQPGTSSGRSSALMLDGFCIASNRMAVPFIVKAANGLNGAGGVAIANTQPGDTVVSVTGLSGASGDASSSFESTVSVAGQVQQTSASNLSGNVYLFVVFPRS